MEFTNILENGRAFISHWALLFIASCSLNVGFSFEANLNSARSFEMGIMYWPQKGSITSDEDIKVGLDIALESSELLVAQVPWSPRGEKLKDSSRWISGVAQETGKKIGIAIEWLHPNRINHFSLDSQKWSFSEQKVQDLFYHDTMDLMRDRSIDFLALGVEVNYLALFHPDSYRGFVHVCQRILRSVKEDGIETKLLVTFQYELLVGKHYGYSNPQPLSFLRDFGNLDSVGISTYPCLTGRDPLQQVNNGHYDDLKSLGKDIVIFEFAHPSFGAESDSAYESKLLDSCLKEFNHAGIDIVVWTSAIDSSPEHIFLSNTASWKHLTVEWRGQLGLATLEGKNKPFSRVWLDWLNLPKVDP